MSDVIPIRLEKTDQRELLIEWSDGMEQRIPFRRLRDACQCATCREKAKADEPAQPRGMLPVLSAAEAQPLDLVGMQPAGNYGYSIQFSDGHGTGIYSLELLRSLKSDK